MERVAKLFIGEDFIKILSLIDEEILFKIGNEEYWMPIQRQLLGPMKEEIKDVLPWFRCIYFFKVARTRRFWGFILLAFINHSLVLYLGLKSKAAQ